MHLLNKDKQDGLIYDPIIKGYDSSFWATVTGTPTATGSPQIIQYNAASSASFILFEFADIEFSVNVPNNPTSGDSRIWGLKSPAATQVGALYFQITGTTFQFVMYDSNGNQSLYPLTWINGTYTSAIIRFRIRWDFDFVFVYVNDVLIYSIPNSNPSDKAVTTKNAKDLPKMALPIYILNGDSDNMQISYIEVRRAAGIV